MKKAKTGGCQPSNHQTSRRQVAKKSLEKSKSKETVRLVFFQAQRQFEDKAAAAKGRRPTLTCALLLFLRLNL